LRARRGGRGQGRRTPLSALRARVAELEETLRAIRSGEVDALVVPGRGGDQIFTLEGADFPFRMLIEQMGEGAVTASLDGVVTYANRSFARICGRPLQQVIGASIYGFWPPESAAALRVLVDRSAKEPSSGEFVLVSEKGPLAAHVSVNRLAAYDKPALMLVITDLTERKQRDKLAESGKRLQKFNAELEGRVRERTRELTALNQDLEAFSYSASHDLRAPLRSINGFGDLLRRDLGPRLGAEGKHRLARIQDAARRMGEVIDGLLALSRLGRDEVVIETLDLTAMAEEAVSELSRADPRRKASVRVSGGMKARGDRRLVSLLLHNLLSNAWKYAKRPRGSIEVSSRLEAGRRVYFVKDDGVGFDQEYAETIFEPFKRLHTREEYPGTGIGLSLARRIVVRHGGWIRAQGAPGRGATFFFTLGERGGRAVA
jgi:PAS domain S-box-containing protein